MLTRPLSRTSRTSSQILWRLRRLRWTQGVLAILAAATATAMTIGADAQDKNVTAGFHMLKCIEETDDGGAADEPYLVIFALNLRTGAPVTLRTPVFEDTDRGEVKGQDVSVMIWPEHNPTQAVNPPDLLILVALMENDDSNPENVRIAVQRTLTSRYYELRLQGAGRESVKQILIREFDAALLRGGRAFGNEDEHIGGTQELRVPPVFGTRFVGLTFAGDGGKYQAFFMVKSERDLVRQGGVRNPGVAVNPTGNGSSNEQNSPGQPPTTPAITGRWNSTIGVTYDIERGPGNQFTWYAWGLNQTASGAVNGKTLTATWRGLFGFASATGRITAVDASGRATRIEWDNQAVFSR